MEFKEKGILRVVKKRDRSDDLFLLDSDVFHKNLSAVVPTLIRLNKISGLLENLHLLNPIFSRSTAALDRRSGDRCAEVLN